MKKLFSLLAVLLFAGSMMAAEATLKYSGSTTTNMVGNGANNAATVGLDADLFTVLADKGSNTNLPGLNKAGDIRLYAAKDDGKGNTITVSIANGTIKSIVLDIKQNTSFEVKNGTEAVTESDGKYVIGSKTFSIQNTTKGESTQLQLNKITITYDEWSEITFTAATATGVFNDSVFAAGDFKLTCVDTENKKLKTTANNCVFGTSADDKTTYAFRLQTGGKSSSKNMMNLTIPADGQLRIAVRTGSNDDATRTVILTQGETELYNKVVTENDTIEGVTNPKVYKYITVNVKKGTVAVTYPVNALNFYSFAFKAADEPTPEPAVANYCQTEITHFNLPAETASAVILSVGVKGEKTIVRIDKKNAEAANLDFLQVTPNNVGSQLEEGGSEALAVEFNTPTPVNDSLTLEILWSTVGNPGNWMVQNLRVAVADCEKAVVPVTPISCDNIYKAAKGDKVALKDVIVTYVNGKNVYVKDESGAMLLYLPANATWKAGDKLAGVEGEVDIYNGLYEVKPSADQVAAVVVTAGEAPAPVELTVAPVAADVNKYVILKNVSVAAGEFKTDKATNLDLTIGEAKVTLRNNFKIAQVFDADEKYNIVGAVAVYNDAVQLYFISAEEIIVPALNIMAYGLKAGDVADNKVTIDYKLNAKATAVEIQLLDAEGAVKKSFDATGLKKGANQEVLDLEGVAAGTYNWAVKATAKPNNAAEPIQVATAGSGSAMGRAVTIDNSYESPYYGNIYQTCGLGVGLYGFDAALNPLFNGQPVAKNGWTATSNSSPCAATVGEDGLVYINDWSDSKPNVRIFNPATPEADAKDVFGGTASGTKGHMVNEAGDTIHASMRYCYPKGTGENTVLYTVDEDYKPGDVTHVFTYNIGTAETPWTSKPSGEGFTHAMTGGKWAGTVDNITFVPSKQEGGWWIAQHRYTDGAAVPALMHIAGDTLNYNSTGEFANATVGYNNQGDFAINHEQSIIVTATNNTKFNILVWDVEWNDNIPSVKAKYTVPSGFTAACLGLGLDDAGNIYASAPNKPVTIWALPKAENNCTTPAAKASKIVVTGTGTAIDNSFVPVKAQKVVVNGQVLIIKDGKTYNMMGQIVE